MVLEVQMFRVEDIPGLVDYFLVYLPMAQGESIPEAMARETENPSSESVFVEMKKRAGEGKTPVLCPELLTSKE